MNRTSALETIFKLSKLADPKNGAYQGEMETAVSKIQELMDRYSITPEDIEIAEIDRSRKELDGVFSDALTDHYSGLKAWHWKLAHLVGRATHTMCYATIYSGYGSSTKVVKFYGKKTNAEVAASLYMQWMDSLKAASASAYDEYWKVLVKKYDYAGWKRRKNSGVEYRKFMDTIPYAERTTFFRESWIRGCLDGMNRVINVAERNRTTEMAGALAVYDQGLADAFNKHLGKHKTTKSRWSGSSSLGYASGYETGKNTDITAKKLK